MATKLDKQLTLAKAYAMAASITDNFIPLNLPVIFKVTAAKSWKNAGLYELHTEISLHKGLREYHHITIGYNFQYSDVELFDSVLHELAHAKDVELAMAKGIRTEKIMPKHTPAFWRRMNKVLKACGLPPVDKQHRKECQKND